MWGRGFVERTPNAETGFVQNMRIDHRRGNILVSQEFLDRPDVVAAFEQMGGKAMTESVTTGRLGDAGGEDGLFYSVLEILFWDVMTANLATTGIERRLGRREDILPNPGSLGVRIFSTQG